jgi:hypothetical protein
MLPVLSRRFNMSGQCKAITEPRVRVGLTHIEASVTRCIAQPDPAFGELDARTVLDME